MSEIGDQRKDGFSRTFDEGVIRLQEGQQVGVELLLVREGQTVGVPLNRLSGWRP
jgi:hypothetical protein